jgi:hypothetical protein
VGNPRCPISCPHGSLIWAEGFIAQTRESEFSAGSVTLIGEPVGLLALLIKEHSALTAAVPPLISAPAALFFKRWKSGADSQTSVPFDATDVSSFFRIQEAPSLLRTVLPVALISIAFQAGVGVLLLGSLGAGLLFAICTVLLIWALPIKLQTDGAN